MNHTHKRRLLTVAGHVSTSNTHQNGAAGLLQRIAALFGGSQRESVSSDDDEAVESSAASPNVRGVVKLCFIADQVFVRAMTFELCGPLGLSCK